MDKSLKTVFKKILNKVNVWNELLMAVSKFFPPLITADNFTYSMKYCRI